MEKQQGKAPQIRFPEFKDAWVNKFGNEVFKSVSDKNHNSDLPILAISQEFGAVPRELINYQISVTEKSIESYKVIEVGDFIISLRSFQGGIEYSNYKGICSPAYIILRPFTEMDRRFFKYYFKTYKYIQHLNKKLEGIRDGKMISYKYFSEIAMPFPSIPEQTRIASFFTVLDKKIVELKQKKTLLEQYKKGVMQKIFSQEIRFKDENGKEFPKWEKKKLGEICEIVGGGTPETSKEEYWNGNILWFTPTEIKSDFVTKSIRTITEFGLQKSSAKKLPKGTILLTSRATIGEAAIALEECTTNQVFQSLIVNEGSNNIFLFNWIKENKYELIVRSNGSTFPEVSKSEIEKIILPIPCLAEQTKIANFLTAIDEKINRTENQIQQTQEYKKGLLQKMFC